jgi:4-hydroxy-2-oxoheptanedioate aldolase
LYGIWAGMASAYNAEILATTGHDWILLDGEHAPNTVPTLLGQLQALAAYPVNPVVRIPHGDPALIKQVLDIGAQTLMVPMVESAAQAAALVRAMRYPPAGIRGVGGGLIRATRWDAVADYIAQADQALAWWCRSSLHSSGTRGADSRCGRRGCHLYRPGGLIHQHGPRG